MIYMLERRDEKNRRKWKGKERKKRKRTRGRKRERVGKIYHSMDVSRDQLKLLHVLCAISYQPMPHPKPTFVIYHNRLRREIILCVNSSQSLLTCILYFLV